MPALGTNQKRFREPPRKNSEGIKNWAGIVDEWQAYFRYRGAWQRHLCDEFNLFQGWQGICMGPNVGNYLHRILMPRWHLWFRSTSAFLSLSHRPYLFLTCFFSLIRFTELTKVSIVKYSRVQISRNCAAILTNRNWFTLSADYNFIN